MICDYSIFSKLLIINIIKEHTILIIHIFEEIKFRCIK